MCIIFGIIRIPFNHQVIFSITIKVTNIYVVSGMTVTRPVTKVYGSHLRFPDRCLATIFVFTAFARGFPAFARATGTGFVLGVGRAGAAGSPIIAGFLFTWLGNSELLTVSAIMSIGAIIGAGLLWMLPMRDPDYEESDAEQDEDGEGGHGPAGRAGADSSPVTLKDLSTSTVTRCPPVVVRWAS